jgi:succinate-semialdehyde dehydrogenase / glutarate-semialdehyde dehydrogenase
MTTTHAPGLPIVEDGLLVSTNPATGEEVARVPIARTDDVAAAVDRARAAAGWWAGLGFAGRRTRLLGFRSILANRMPEIAELLRRECGKPVVDGWSRPPHSSPTSSSGPGAEAPRQGGDHHCRSDEV